MASLVPRLRRPRQSAVRIEAQAKAGELLREVRERGDMADRGQRKQDRTSQRATSTLDDLGVTRSESSRWQQVADVPELPSGRMCVGHR